MTVFRTFCLLALLGADKIALAEKHQVINGLADVDEDMVPEEGGRDSGEMGKQILLAVVATAVLALIVFALYRWKQRRDAAGGRSKKNSSSGFSFFRDEESKSDGRSTGTSVRQALGMEEAPPPKKSGWSKVKNALKIGKGK